MKNILVTGSIPALVTPFDKDQSIDLVSWKKWVSWHDKQSSRAVVVFGSTGEGLSLTFSEREMLLATARKNLNSSAMIVGIASSHTEQAIIQANQAKQQGAQAILLTCPYYVKPDQNGLCQHYQKISQAVNMPIILYTVPSRTGIDFSEKTLLTLAHDSNIIGIKDASGKLERMKELKQVLPNNFIFLGGNDSEIICNLENKGDGTISVIANILPNLIQSIVDNYKANPQWSKGKFNGIRDIIQQIELNGNPQAIKQMVKSIFSIPSTLRLPLTELEESKQKDISKCLFECGLEPEEIG
ncbi:MAG: 4-hydroxy-tetrahydrodipicolinate synthase [Pseudomonadota bacterium]|nr:4-hydroxy-tetrahydrodipicolinate synthase [Pseudomonadota bacterium]